MPRWAIVKRFRGGLVFKAHRLLHHSTLGLRVIKKKKKDAEVCNCFRVQGVPRGSGLRVQGCPRELGVREALDLPRVHGYEGLGVRGSTAGGRGGSFINLRTTTSQKCEAVPRRARM